MIRRLITLACTVAVALAGATGTTRRRPPTARCCTWARTRETGARASTRFASTRRAERLQPIGLAARTSNPSFLAVHPNGRWLYAVNTAHLSGRFVYASNRGHDSIAVFGTAVRTGALAAVGHVPTGGRTPRNFALDPQGRWLVAANQNSSSLVAFRVNEKTGMLDRTGDPTVIPMPVCVLFVPSST